MTIQQRPKYDMRFNPVYQIDFQNGASGKLFGVTKRRIKFRFGFSNAKAIQAGKVGVDCRGEEHDVTLVWSLISGKKLVIVDGQDIHFSCSKITDTTFETSWTMAGGHTVKITAHAVPPMQAGARQFELFLDGCSFFSMPRIFELGQNVDRSVRVADTGADYDCSATPIHQDNRMQSYGEYDRTMSFATASFSRRTEPQYDEPRTPPQQRPVTVTPPRAIQQASVSQGPVVEDHLYTPTAPVQDHLYTPEVAPQQIQDEFTPVAPAPKTYQSFALEIMNAYVVPANPFMALANESHTYGAPSSDDSRPPSPVPVSPASSGPPSPVHMRPTMEPLTLPEMEARELPENMSELEKAVKTLCFLDDITQSVATPQQVKAEREKESKIKLNKPLAPTKPVWHLGLKPALGDIQAHKTMEQPKKQVMRTHAFDPAAAQHGMMVVYGDTMPSGATGFGAGVHPSHYAHAQPHYNQQQYAAGYSQQQAVAPAYQHVR